MSRLQCFPAKSEAVIGASSVAREKDILFLKQKLAAAGVGSDENDRVAFHLCRVFSNCDTWNELRILPKPTLETLLKPPLMDERSSSNLLCYIEHTRGENELENVKLESPLKKRSRKRNKILGKNPRKNLQCLAACAAFEASQTKVAESSPLAHNKAPASFDYNQQKQQQDLRSLLKYRKELTLWSRTKSLEEIYWWLKKFNDDVMSASKVFSSRQGEALQQEAQLVLAAKLDQHQTMHNILSQRLSEQGLATQQQQQPKEPHQQPRPCLLLPQPTSLDALQHHWMPNPNQIIEGKTGPPQQLELDADLAKGTNNAPSVAVKETKKYPEKGGGSDFQERGPLIDGSALNFDTNARVGLFMTTV
mmetsp:Transcript_28752/g.58776  ORF Transcript_28752/g.58776 Transcript_28752/m.58776 type:complete len:363 (-) Transcript_28752:297-1385(-)